MSLNTITDEQKHLAKMFIKKFEAIPEERWCLDTVDNGRGAHCAIGHLNGRFFNGNKWDSEEANQLSNLIEHPVGINNYNYGGKYPQPTPKLRILAALRDVLAL